MPCRRKCAGWRAQCKWQLRRSFSDGHQHSCSECGGAPTYWHLTAVRVAAVAAGAAAVVAATAVGVVVVGKWITRCRVFALLCLVCLPPFLLLHFSPLPLRQGSGSLRPCRHREPVRLPSWLLAMFVDGLAPSAYVVRCPHGSTQHFATMSCVCSTHHSLRASNSFSSLQRILLALSSLLFLRATPGP